MYFRSLTFPPLQASEKLSEIIVVTHSLAFEGFLQADAIKLRWTVSGNISHGNCDKIAFAILLFKTIALFAANNIGADLRDHTSLSEHSS